MKACSCATAPARCMEHTNRQTRRIPANLTKIHFIFKLRLKANFSSLSLPNPAGRKLLSPAEVGRLCLAPTLALSPGTPSPDWRRRNRQSGDGVPGTQPWLRAPIKRNTRGNKLEDEYSEAKDQWEAAGRREGAPQKIQKEAYAFCAARRRNVGTSRSSAVVAVFS